MTLIDLLYISNFKGGNATINEPEEEINIKLIFYSNKLIDIDKEFKNKSLADLTFEQKEKLKILVDDICELTFKESKNRIDGFNVSYLSALLNAYFPEVIPILDRRVLINLELVKQDDIDGQGQIKNIQYFFKMLIDQVSKISRDSGKSIREIDRQLFVMRIEKPFTSNDVINQSEDDLLADI